MTKRTKFAAIAATALTALALSAGPAAAVPDPGQPVNPYPSPNPPTSPVEDSPAWYCFQWGPGPAPGASQHMYKVWCPKDVTPGAIYGSDGVHYKEFAWTTCGNDYPLDHIFNEWACNAVWKAYPYPTPF
jgi:hypothetical protein